MVQFLKKAWNKSSIVGLDGDIIHNLDGMANRRQSQSAGLERFTVKVTHQG
jgi:hypothetical protein